MAMAMDNTLTLKGLVDLLEDRTEDETFPFYAVLIYPHLNGLNRRMHEYVVSHWLFLNDLTGSNALLVAIEDLTNDRSIETFQPAEVYSIAREFGVTPEAVPCLVLFTDPHHRREIEVMWLRDFLPYPASDEDITDFFQRLQTIIDACAIESTDDRLTCLRDALERGWPERDDEPSGEGKSGRLVETLASSSTILASLLKIIETIG